MTIAAPRIPPKRLRLAVSAAVLLVIAIGPLLLLKHLWYIAAIALMVIAMTVLVEWVLGMPKDPTTR